MSAHLRRVILWGTDRSALGETVERAEGAAYFCSVCSGHGAAPSVLAATRFLLDHLEADHPDTVP